MLDLYSNNKDVDLVTLDSDEDSDRESGTVVDDREEESPDVDIVELSDEEQSVLSPPTPPTVIPLIKRKLGPKSKTQVETGTTARDRPCPASKKRKTPPVEEETEVKAKRACSSTKNAGRCKFCHQNLANVSHKSADVPGSLNETQMLSHYNVCADSNQEDHPLCFLTNYSLYDDDGHLVALDSDLIVNGKGVKFSGNAKLVDIEPENPEGGVAVKQIGPITEWWVTGYDDDDEEYAIGISTDKADYLIKKNPGPGYEACHRILDEKVRLTKIMFKCAGSYNKALQLDYEDLLIEIFNEITNFDIPNFNREMLTQHTPFIIEQIKSYLGDEKDAEELLQTQCMIQLMDMAGMREEAEIIDISSGDSENSEDSEAEIISEADHSSDDDYEDYGKTRKSKKSGKKQRSAKNKKTRRKLSLSTRRRQMASTSNVRTALPEQTKAVTTPLVMAVFQTAFENQMRKEDKEIKSQKGPHRCGTCVNCRQKDCGQCGGCKAMIKYGGDGRGKKSCVKKICVEAADDITVVDEIASMVNEERTKHIKIEFPDLPIRRAEDETFYDKVKINFDEYSIGDFVLIRPDVEGTAFFVAHVLSLYNETKTEENRAHVRYFCRGTDTVLGETEERQELFSLDWCEDVELSDFVRKVNVRFWPVPTNWKEQGGTVEAAQCPDFEEYSYYFRMKYEGKCARFESVNFEKEFEEILTNSRIGNCPLCQQLNEISSSHKPSIVNGKCFKYKQEQYHVGDAVFLMPDTYAMPFKKKSFEGPMKELKNKWEEKNPETYPEFYRHSGTGIKGSNFNNPDPFQIGVIEEVVLKNEDEVVMKVRKIFRPEDLGIIDSDEYDINCLFWSDEFANVNATEVQGKLVLMPKKLIRTSLHMWSSEGPYRFYIDKSFGGASKEIEPLPQHVLERYKHRQMSGEAEKKYDKVRPLNSLDVFAGCGGLSRGLEDGGVADCKWAIENFAPAAKAFERNFPKSQVFIEDCNTLLQRVMDGQMHNEEGKNYPQRGEVEMLVGGPPCQGFSMMNHFSEREYSQFKNSLVASYLSYCDYYRPQYFILENVQNFALMKKNLVLKLCLKSLVRMGYQCCFGILQAGHFGVPQTRRRCIILAAAPGLNLPFYPEPDHVFAKTPLVSNIDDKTFGSNVRWKESAPFRTITVSDAISDLPEVSMGAYETSIPYDSKPITHFQRNIRFDKKSGSYMRTLGDHICRKMTPLNVARINHIPTNTGADWRDLPNIEVELDNGEITDILVYNFKQKTLPPSHPNRAVCICNSTKKVVKCSPEYFKQSNTLIPWSLVHTANRHNNWAGLFARIHWNGHFSTTVTNPDPMGKQGRVLHPKQNRVVTVRECARSQGFHDGFVFEGLLMDKHRQIGNAVPPPMGLALGREIAKALAKTKKETNTAKKSSN